MLRSPPETTAHMRYLNVQRQPAHIAGYALPEIGLSLEGWSRRFLAVFLAGCLVWVRRGRSFRLWAGEEGEHWQQEP